MANTKYFLAENYLHHRTKTYPKSQLNTFPICPICNKPIYEDNINREWACSDPNCIMR